MSKGKKYLLLGVLAVVLVALAAGLLVKFPEANAPTADIQQVQPQTEKEPAVPVPEKVILNTPVEKPEPREIKSFDDFKTRMAELKGRAAAKFEMLSEHLKIQRKNYLFGLIGLLSLAAIITLLVLTISTQRSLDALSTDSTQREEIESTFMVGVFGWQPFFTHPLFIFAAIYAIISIALICVDALLSGPTRASLILLSSPLISLTFFGVLFLLFMPTLFICFLLTLLFVYALVTIAKHYNKEWHLAARIAIKFAFVLCYILALPFLFVILILFAFKYVYCALVQLISFFKAGLRMDKEWKALRTYFDGIIGLSKSSFAFMYANDSKPLSDYWDRIAEIVPIYRKQMGGV